MRTDLLWPQHTQQHYNVGALHARPDRVAVYYKSVYHQYLCQFRAHRAPGLAGFRGVSARDMVAGRRDDGGWVYFSWDEGEGELTRRYFGYDMD